MKKIYLLSALAALCCIIIISCSKKSDPVKNPNPFDYIVNSVQDISIEQNGSASTVWETRLLTGTPENVKLSLSGLPANVTATPSTAEGLPTYATSVVFNTTAAAIGTYPLTITATSASAATKTYKFNLIVTAASDCATPLVGSYTTNDTCSSYNGSYTTNISKGNSSNSIVIENFGNFSSSTNSVKINATLDCATNTVTVPSQNISGYTFSGTGTFTTNGLRINYTTSYYVNGAPVSDHCVCVFTK